MCVPNCPQSFMHSESCPLSTCPPADSLSASHWRILWIGFSLHVVSLQDWGGTFTPWITGNFCGWHSLDFLLNWKRVMSWCWTGVKQASLWEMCETPLYPARAPDRPFWLYRESQPHTPCHTLSPSPETVCPSASPMTERMKAGAIPQAELSPRTQSSSSTAVTSLVLIWKDRWEFCLRRFCRDLLEAYWQWLDALL